MDVPTGRWVGRKLSDDVENSVGILAQLSGVPITQSLEVSGQQFPVRGFATVRLKLFGRTDRKNGTNEWAKLVRGNRTSPYRVKVGPETAF
jgi:hypothetical protein